jgi:hypothetical protein
MVWLSLALIFSLGTPAAVDRKASSYLQQERFQDADKLCRTALALFETAYGPDSLETALILNDLTLAYRGEGFRRGIRN